MTVSSTVRQTMLSKRVEGLAKATTPLLFRDPYISYYGKRRYGDDHYKCATGDVENGSALEGLADGYRGTEQIKS